MSATTDLIETALAKMPACCFGAYENLLTDSGRADNLKDMLDAVDHELALYAEGQDGCMLPNEDTECRQFKAWLQNACRAVALNPRTPEGTPEHQNSVKPLGKRRLP